MDKHDVMVWAICALAVVGIAWAPVSCTMNSNTKIAEMVANGADPIKARCSMGMDSTNVVCALAVEKSK